jgi:hypothetical protein
LGHLGAPLGGSFICAQAWRHHGESNAEDILAGGFGLLIDHRSDRQNSSPDFRSSNSSVALLSAALVTKSMSMPRAPRSAALRHAVRAHSYGHAHTSCRSNLL